MYVFNVDKTHGNLAFDWGLVMKHIVWKALCLQKKKTGRSGSDECSRRSLILSSLHTGNELRIVSVLYGSNNLNIGHTEARTFEIEGKIGEDRESEP
jgi:hypothetical protein